MPDRNNERRTPRLAAHLFSKLERLRYLAVAAPFAMVLAATSCADDGRVVVGGIGPMPEAGSDPVFVEPGQEAGTPPLLMCASTECPAPYADCPTSPYRCGTHLGDDPNNCGACGRKCPDDPVLQAYMASGAAATMKLAWDCVEGKCSARCHEPLANCNGHLEDGCEVDVTCDPENCGACGNKCAPGQACVFGTCGCPSGLTACGPGQCSDAQCADTKTDFFNCGTCGNVCNVRPPDLDLKEHMDWGCAEGSCGVVCASDWSECDHDLENGCETNITTVENCGACGKACKATEACIEKRCVCDPTKTNCCENDQVVCDGACVALKSNPDNCGECGHKCPGAPVDGGDGNVQVTCVQGKCGYACEPGYADCNQDLSDGCESWLRFDANNCGACGNACAPGQPCVEGACATEPCDAGPTTSR